MSRKRKGTSLIDLIVSMGILAVLFGGIYLVYFSIITAIQNINIRSAAATAIASEIETVRNLPYESVGTVGGIPAGTIPQTQIVTVDNYSLTLQTSVRNIDDPFDGTLGGTPDDTAPADYKLVSIDASCPLCSSAVSVEITTTVAPKNLESATQDGTLFLYAVDADGNPVSGATMHVVNASVTPSIDLTDTTNASGVLQLVGVPTSTQNYAVTAAKPGYSTDWSDPNLTVVAQTVTASTFAIDKVSQLTVYTSDNRCSPVADIPFSMQGAKLIGPAPGAIKFSTTTATDASGAAVFQNLEWDTYTVTPEDAAENMAGTIPFDPVTINPGVTSNFRVIVSPAKNPALLATIVDAVTGAGIANATATLSKSGFSETLSTGHATFSQTDWSGGQYADQSGGLDPETSPGKLTLLANASGTYPTGAAAWLISNTFDVGGASSTFYQISWDPASQSPQTGANSLEFQVAANNDNATWNFIGPDGTSGSYFTAAGDLPASLAGNRYFRYKAYLSTQDESVTPELDDAIFDFTADCVPPAQVLFTALPQGSYTLDVAAQNYTEATATVSVGAGFQTSTIELTGK